MEYIGQIGVTPFNGHLKIQKKSERGFKNKKYQAVEVSPTVDYLASIIMADFATIMMVGPVIMVSGKIWSQ